VIAKPNGATIKKLLSNNKNEKVKVFANTEIQIKKTKKEYKDDILRVELFLILTLTIHIKMKDNIYISKL
jgi:hypothetical protein